MSPDSDRSPGIAGSPEPDIERLYWQCRRGMLELDYLLRDFLDRDYKALDANGRRNFVRLLDFPDQELHDWFMGYRVPDEPELAELVQRMRTFRRHPDSNAG